MAAQGGYEPATDGTKAQFARKQLAEYVRSIVITHEIQQKQEQAIAVVEAEVGGIV